MEKKIIIALCIIVVLEFISNIITGFFTKSVINGYKEELVVKDSIYNQTIDSLNTIVKTDKDSIIFYKNSLDSCGTELDSMYEDLTVANIKLERIKEYNRIAAKGNNITFLRGWINRVLND